MPPGPHRGPKSRAGAISTDKHGPADVVTADLILEDKISNLAWKLLTLPLTLDAAGLSVARISSLHRLDRVGSRTEVVFRNMPNTRSLTCGVGRETRSLTKWSSCAHGVAAQSPSLHHLHSSVGPRTRRVDRLAWPSVS
jgi:hypothetical protein